MASGITIMGQGYGVEAFSSDASPPEFVTTPFGEDLWLFLKEWFSDSPLLQVKTSGSTGAPKLMQVEKSRMKASAQLTCHYLGLARGDSALLCMPLDYIAGKMMVVRSVVAGLNLCFVTPSSRPLEQIETPFSFAAMTPMQVFNSLQHESDRTRLALIEQLIVGGGAVDREMAQALKSFPHQVYSTYGMTETLSHIALRRLNGENASDLYYPFESVALSLSEQDGTLVIDAPLVAEKTLYTHDVAEIDADGGFRILGRKDNIINSGGIKIQAEEVEAMLSTIIEGHFAITSIPDTQFGEIVVLAVEKDVDEKRVLACLPQYYRPKKIIQLREIPLTETKKIRRAALKEHVLKSLLEP